MRRERLETGLDLSRVALAEGSPTFSRSEEFRRVIHFSNADVLDSCLAFSPRGLRSRVQGLAGSACYNATNVALAGVGDSQL